MHYKIESNKVKTTKWWGTKADAEAAFERACKRSKIAPPMHFPGRVSGDGTTKTNIGYRVEGVRNGHGYVYLEAVG